jgi:hypothetical protein
MAERRFAKRVLVGKPEGKRPLEKSRRGEENNIKMDLQGVRWWALIELMWLRTRISGKLL